MADALRLTTHDHDTLLVEDSVRTNDAAFIYIANPYHTASAHLTAQEVRKLIDRLEPLAAPALTALDIFNDFPVGQVFAWTDADKRVKVSATHYVLLRDGDGVPNHYLAEQTLTCQPSDAIKAVTA